MTEETPIRPRHDEDKRVSIVDDKRSHEMHIRINTYGAGRALADAIADFARKVVDDTNLGDYEEGPYEYEYDE